MARKDSIEARTLEIGTDIFTKMKGQTPSIFNKAWWNGRMMEWCMKDDAFKVEMFRFVDVLPTLRTPEAIARHLKEYFCRPEQDFPAALQWGLKAVSPTSRIAKMAANTINKNVHGMAAQFIVGTDAASAFPKLAEMRRTNVAFTVDLLGEKTVSEKEALDYLERYLALFSGLTAATKEWERSSLLDSDAFGDIPTTNVSVKLSALFSQADVLDFEGSVNGFLERLRPLFRKAKEQGAFINVDMEHYAMKDLTLEVFRRIVTEPEFQTGPQCGIVVQAYLKDSKQDLEGLLKLAKKSKRSFTVRLVKGAYWDYEVVQAQQHGWDIPVFEEKAETDANYEDLVDLLLATRGKVKTAIGSHNVRNIAYTMARAEALGLEKNAVEFQMLFGMAEPIKRTLIEGGYRVRDYAPVGEILPGMAYLVRRLLENTSNEGFLRSSFADSISTEVLLAKPVAVGQSAAPEMHFADWGPNAPYIDFRAPGQGVEFAKALARCRKKTLGRPVPVVVGGEKKSTGRSLASVYPADPNLVVAECALASEADVQQAIELSKRSAKSWAEVSPSGRADVLRAAARDLAKQRKQLAALQVFEVGKNWREADADVCEAVDFLNYYATEMERLGRGIRMGMYPGEMNRLRYFPKGIGAVIAPWNFPLAIITGMTAAALAAGNAVLMKPAEQSPAVAYGLYKALIDAGVPKGVLHFLPGIGEEIGPTMVNHPDVDFIAFTGSKAVGLDILRSTSEIRPGQRGVKRVIAEMGGKNAVIVDDDADLDEAVTGVVSSAFGFQGQKCSACSRAIVVGDAYEPFTERLIEAVNSVTIGPPTDPHYKVNTVIDAEAQARIQRTVDAAKGELQLAVQRPVPDNGYYVSPTVFIDADPNHSICQEEIFGPVLAVVRAATFEEAIEIANGTKYALTGGLFSRSPAHIEAIRTELRAGNLYINRGITGALVGRQPFGGFDMSGVGSKAGGPDYLHQFLEPRVVTENTMRRGFSPETI